MWWFLLFDTHEYTTSDLLVGYSGHYISVITSLDFSFICNDLIDLIKFNQIIYLIKSSFDQIIFFHLLQK